LDRKFLKKNKITRQNREHEESLKKKFIHMVFVSKTPQKIEKLENGKFYNFAFICKAQKEKVLLH
jgi:hypothetical protein